MNIKKYTSKYFLLTEKILKNKNKTISTMKFFCFQDNVCLSGINYIKELIKKEKKKGNLNHVLIFSRQDGDIINSYEPIIIIKGEYNKFSYLENIIDGILSRMSSVSTNCKEFKNKAKDKKIIFMADRSDFFLNQPLDGYSGYIGGITDFVTKGLISLIPKNKKINHVGTMPHSLIQQCNGDIIKAIELTIKTFPKNNIVALIDYHNDAIKEIEKIANSKFKNKIYAIRIDTSISIIDNSLIKFKNNKEYYGVNHHLIKSIRNKLDESGMINVKIIATSGIDLNKINKFEKLKTPVDIYGIGSALIKKTVHFAGDLIKLENKYESKYGRSQNIEKEIKLLKRW